MRRAVMQCVLALGLFALAPLSVMAQDTPRAEVFGGASYLNINGEGHAGGWHASAVGSINESFGIGVDASGHYNSGNGLYFVMAGPRFKHRGERVEPFAHALFGVAFSTSDAQFSMGFGGGVDVKVTDNVAVRVVQADYAPIIFSDGALHNARISAGVVFRFGE